MRHPAAALAAIVLTAGMVSIATSASAATAPLGSPQTTPRTLQAAQIPPGHQALSLPATCRTAMQRLPELKSEHVNRVGCISHQASPRPAWAKSYVPARGEAKAVTPSDPSDDAPCVDGAWYYYRLDACGVTDDYFDVIDIDTGELVGELDFTVTDQFVLAYNSATFAENVDIEFTDGWGLLPETATLDVTCGGTCTADSLLSDEPVEVGSDAIGVVTYDDSTTSVDTTYSSYELFFEGVDVVTLEPATWSSIDYRCDDVLPGNIGAGCVFPDYIPEIDMSSLPAIDANIAAVQAAGPHSYGEYGFGNPLHRNSALQAQNNAAACPPPGPQPPNTNCDEYPFATTQEGASQTQQPDWGSAWVPVTENSSQGTMVSTFYLQNRILTAGVGVVTGDAFWVYAV